MFFCLQLDFLLLFKALIGIVYGLGVRGLRPRQAWFKALVGIV